MNYSQIISKFAKNEYTIHSVKREWRVIIIILLVLKIATMAISMFSDFFFFADFLIPIVNNTIVVNITTILFLIIIEFIVAILLTKFAKFGIRKQYEKTVIIGLFCFFIFGINFYTSTNGLANRQAKKADKTENITGLKQVKIQNVVSEYDSRIKDLKNQIELIKSNPLQWLNGKQTALTAAQLKSIESLTIKINGLYEQKNNEIMAIESAFKVNYSQNDLFVSEVSTRYYVFISTILIIKLISNIGLMFFFSMIYKEEDRENMLQNEFDSYFVEVENKLIEKKISELKKIDDRINGIFLNYGGQKSIPQKIEKTIKQIGFRPVNDNKQTAVNTTETTEKRQNNAVNGKNNGILPVNSLMANEGICGFCGTKFIKTKPNKLFCSPKCRISNFHLNKL